MPKDRHPAEGDAAGIGARSAWRELFLNWYTTAMLTLLAARALAIPLSGFRTFPLDYWRSPDVLPGAVYFLNVLLLGLAHSVYYAFCLPRFFCWLHPGVLSVPFAVLGFVAAGFVPYVIGFATMKRWRVGPGVVIVLGAGLIILQLTAIHLLIFCVSVLLPYALALPTIRLWKSPRAPLVPLGIGLAALVALNLYCGYHLLIGMVPSM